MKHWRVTQTGGDNDLCFYVLADTQQAALKTVEMVTGPLTSQFNNLRAKVQELQEFPEGADFFTAV